MSVCVCARALVLVWRRGNSVTISLRAEADKNGEIGVACKADGYLQWQCLPQSTYERGPKDTSPTDCCCVGKHGASGITDWSETAVGSSVGARAMERDSLIITPLFVEAVFCWGTLLFSPPPLFPVPTTMYAGLNSTWLVCQGLNWPAGLHIAYTFRGSTIAGQAGWEAGGSDL
jgi:hypothetical protein